MRNPDIQKLKAMVREISKNKDKKSQENLFKIITIFDTDIQNILINEYKANL